MPRLLSIVTEYKLFFTLFICISSGNLPDSVTTVLSLNMFTLVACVALLSTAAAFPSSDKLTASNPVDCGGGYKSYGGGNCYKLYDVYVPWNEAKNKCAEDGAYLAVIKTQEEAVTIKEIVSDQSGWAYTWIGLSDKDGNNDWRSVSGTSVNDLYHTWSSAATLKNRCGTVTHLAELEDMPCDTEKLAYICEKSN
ncbi:unnamed protein product [Arctia plantaginis]|uniref:C-type lectin domain-containing protein n=1 Tax=Arctia plantaginis TaxID=874455 RepID=A0A8S0ZZ01_ARCPL|nr:unnamed protein product [Arctia plantaginis]